MITTVYISRHSQSFRDLLGEYNVNEIEQIRNEKNPLSVNGEKRAQVMSNIQELHDIDILYSSHYVRAMSTAKYIAENNNIKLNVDERLGERRFGIDRIEKLPKDFFEKQFKDWNYKLINGESLNEVKSRMLEVIFEIIDNDKGKKIMLLSHGTALTTMLSKWCDTRYNDESKLVEIYFKNKLVFPGNWQAPELFKLTFDERELIDIENIKIEY